MTAFLHASHFEHLVGKFRSVVQFHFKKDQLTVKEIVRVARLFLFMFVGVAAGAMRDDSDGLLARFFDETLSRFVELYRPDAQLRRSQSARHERSGDRYCNEERSDLDSFGPLYDVGDRRIDEDQGDEEKSDPLSPAALPG